MVPMLLGISLQRRSTWLYYYVAIIKPTCTCMLILFSLSGLFHTLAWLIISMCLLNLSLQCVMLCHCMPWCHIGLSLSQMKDSKCHMCTSVLGRYYGPLHSECTCVYITTHIWTYLIAGNFQWGKFPYIWRSLVTFAWNWHH